MQARMCKLVRPGRPVVPLLCNAAQLPPCALQGLAGPPVLLKESASWQRLVCCDTHQVCKLFYVHSGRFTQSFKLTWLVLGEDPAARSHRVEQFTAL